MNDNTFISNYFGYLQAIWNVIYANPLIQLIIVLEVIFWVVVGLMALFGRSKG